MDSGTGSSLARSRNCTFSSGDKWSEKVLWGAQNVRVHIYFGPPLKFFSRSASALDQRGVAAVNSGSLPLSSTCTWTSIPCWEQGGMDRQDRAHPGEKDTPGVWARCSQHLAPFPLGGSERGQCIQPTQAHRPAWGMGPPTPALCPQQWRRFSPGPSPAFISLGSGQGRAPPARVQRAP